MMVNRTLKIVALETHEKSLPKLILASAREKLAFFIVAPIFCFAYKNRFNINKKHGNAVKKPQEYPSKLL